MKANVLAGAIFAVLGSLCLESVFKNLIKNDLFWLVLPMFVGVCCGIIVWCIASGQLDANDTGPVEEKEDD